MNPYDCSRSGNLFTGYEDTRRKMVEGLVQGQKSFAVQGGRRCGKSSLLLKLCEDLRASAPPSVRWHIIDMQAVVPRTPSDVFLALYRDIADGIPDSPAAPDTLHRYQDFLKLIDAALPAIDAKLGRRWIIILMVDDFDVAASTLPDDEVFQNLRNFLTSSRHASSFRLVAAGSSRMHDLIKAGSALNNLDPVFLGILPESNATEIVRAGFADARFKQELFTETGRHPFILQGVLAYLWDDPDNLSLASATRRFIRDRMPSIKQWIRDIGEGGTKVYAKLAASADGLPVKSLRAKGLVLDEVLQTLSYHGLIDDSDPDHPRVSSQIFRRWFVENMAIEPDPPVAAPQSTPAKKVFVVYGRNQKLRASMFLFLAELGLQPLEWGDLVECTGNPAPTIIEVLRAGFEIAQAAVVLFTPEDEARLLPAFSLESDPQHECELTPQPRPNVIFEAGMVLAHFPRRTVIVQIGRIRPFTDLSGIHFVELDNSIAARRELLRRLRRAGCAIEDPDTKTGWHHAGNFDL